jgi:tetratricopeptide (TPR) repeat protein
MYKEDTQRYSVRSTAVIAAQQAERLNGNLPEVHLALGSVFNATGKNAQAIEELNRALQLTQIPMKASVGWQKRISMPAVKRKPLRPTESDRCKSLLLGEPQCAGKCLFPVRRNRKALQEYHRSPNWRGEFDRL